MGKLDVLKNKIIGKDEALQAINRWRLKNDTIVFTNGCFDILHLGHVEYLAKAAEEGDRLVVGINSDDSIKRIKGESRPVNNIEARAGVLSALHLVDLVIEFNEDTPEELIKAFTPDVLVKGADWKEEDIVGGDFVKENGGKVATIELTDGYSTTGLIEKLK